MIKVKFLGKRFKIFSNNKIECIENCYNIESDILQDIIKSIEAEYNNPSSGFLVGFIANKLPKYGVEVISFRDYEKEKAPAGRVY
jgi:hypothetical protein